NAINSVLKFGWIYEPSPTPTSPPPSVTLPDEAWVLPSQEILQQIYHLAMMGDIPAIEGMMKELTQQNTQLTLFADELSKLTANFQTAKIRKLLKSLITTELRQ
ncbi:MAG: CHASE2 domain-containing protein, partial [Trichormus sp.]